MERVKIIFQLLTIVFLVFFWQVNPSWASGGKVRPLAKKENSDGFFYPVLGLCEDYPRGTDPEEVERDFALLQKYGIKHLRISIAWKDVEFARGYFDWDLLDEIMKLAKEYDISLAPYICYAPVWATHASWKSPVSDLQDWYNFVFQVVSRYQGMVDSWELWNEGDNNDFYLGSWEQLLEMVKVGAQAVRDADPTALTVFAGLTNTDPGHVETIFKSGVADYFDVINIHFYNETWNPTPIEKIDPTIRKIADVIRKYDGRQEIWVDEVGYSDYIQPNMKVSDWVRAKYSYEHTPKYQAVSFVRTLGQILATEEVSLVGWYEVKNLPLETRAIGDLNNHYLGCMDFDYFPKPLFFALTSMYKLFSPGMKVVDNLLTIEDFTPVTPYSHAYQQENRNIVVLAWIRGEKPGTVKIKIPGVQGKVLEYMPTGVKREVTPTEFESGICLETVINPDGVYIAEVLVDTTLPRLTIDCALQKNSDTKDFMEYEVHCTVRNVGGGATKTCELEAVTSEGVEVLDSTQTKLLGEFPSEKEQIITFRLKVKTRQKNLPKAWFVVRDGLTPPAAYLVSFE